MLEIIATTVEDAILAEKGGADRLELCAALSEDGLTPSAGCIEEVVKAVEIPVHVIVRPHNNGFIYSEADVAVMQKDIAFIRKIGAAGIVIGACTAEKMIDVTVMETLLAEAGELAVTFHRAFDEIDDQLVALKVLQTMPQITRVLTSAGKPSVLQALPQLKALVEATADSELTILAGSGITAEKVDEVLRTGVSEIHLGSGVREERSFARPIDVELVREVQQKMT